MSNQAHIRQHYDIYKAACEAAGIPINHHAIPWLIWNAMRATDGGEPSQAKLNMFFKKEKGRREFDKSVVLIQWQNLLPVMIRYISNSQRSSWITHQFSKLLSTANKVVFCNCLIAMWPQANKSDLPTTHDITMYIHNQFVAHLNALKEDIMVRTIFKPEVLYILYPTVLLVSSWQNIGHIGWLVC